MCGSLNVSLFYDTRYSVCLRDLCSAGKGSDLTASKNRKGLPGDTEGPCRGILCCPAINSYRPSKKILGPHRRPWHCTSGRSCQQHLSKRLLNEIPPKFLKCQILKKKKKKNLLRSTSYSSPALSECRRTPQWHVHAMH